MIGNFIVLQELHVNPHAAAPQIFAATRNHVLKQRLVAHRRRSAWFHIRWLAGGRITYKRTAAFTRRSNVLHVSKQRWVIRRHVFDGSKQIGRPVACYAAWLIATALLVFTSLPADSQVITPLSPPTAPPWNSLEIFDPVPFAQLWSRDPGEPVAPEDTPVKTRQQPGYESPGVRSGPWMFNPSVTAGVLYDSNVFASSSNKHGDLAATIEPALSVSSLWDRHALNIDANVRSRWYREFSALNETDASLRLRGRVDLWHDAAILTNVRVASLHEGVGSLTSPTGAVEPTPYSLASIDVAYWQQFNRLAGSLGVRSDSYNYGSTRAQDGSVINQDSRDGRVDAVHARLDYALSPGLGIFTALEVNQRNLRGTPTQSLSSDGYRALSGLNIELGHLVSGELGAGYASQRFDDPTIGTIQGPAYRAIVNWSVTRMLDLHFKAEQIVTEASDTVAGGIRADALQLGTDYELRRNVVLSVAATVEHDKFFGETRDDDVFSTLSELKFLINRYSYISIQHQYFRRNSSAPSSSYDKHRVGLNVTARY